MIKKYLTLKNLITSLIIIGLVIALFQVDSYRNKEFSSQKAKLDSLTLVNQQLVQTTNQQGQVISKQAVIITDNQSTLASLTSQVFDLKDKEQKRIKQVNALISIASHTKVDSIRVPYVDTLKLKKFSDSLERICRAVIDYYENSTTPVPRHALIDSPYFKFDGTITRSGLTVNSINLPDTQRIAVVETKGGFFKRDINGKIKFHLPSKTEIQVLHTNPNIKVDGISSIVYKPPTKPRWLERGLLFASGIAFKIFALK